VRYSRVIATYHPEGDLEQKKVENKIDKRRRRQKILRTRGQRVAVVREETSYLVQFLFLFFIFFYVLFSPVASKHLETVKAHDSIAPLFPSLSIFFKVFFSSFLFSFSLSQKLKKPNKTWQLRHDKIEFLLSIANFSNGRFDSNPISFSLLSLSFIHFQRQKL
jgi:hypothetical protein